MVRRIGDFLSLRVVAVALLVVCGVLAGMLHLGSSEKVRTLRSDHAAYAELGEHIWRLGDNLWRIRISTTNPDPNETTKAETAFLDATTAARRSVAAIRTASMPNDVRASLLRRLSLAETEAKQFAAQVRRVREAVASGDGPRIIREAERGNRLAEELNRVIAKMNRDVRAKSRANVMAHVVELQAAERVDSLVLLGLLGIAVAFLVLALRGVSDAHQRLHERDAALRDAAAANEAKSTFLAVMSHEIRTPLNGVLGMANGLRGTSLSTEQEEMVDIILGSGRLLNDILSDILDLSRVEAGKLDLHIEPFDLRSMVEQTAALFMETARSKGLALDVTVSEAACGRRDGDANRLRQVLGNLVGNAIKFTDTGAVEVVVSSDGRRTRFEVRDSGPGFSDEVRTRLFKAFEQADGATTRDFGGSGLGLSICQRLVELMGGQIDCAAEVGRGAVFWFDVELPEASSPSATQPEAPAAGRSLDGLRILCADDNITNQRVLSVLLGAAGVQVVHAANGREAVDAWRDGEFDLILLDMQMPVVDGPGAAREIRSLEAEGLSSRIPILALTANAMPQHIEACLKAGMDGHVRKPVEPSALFATILDAMATRPAKDARKAA